MHRLMSCIYYCILLPFCPMYVTPKPHMYAVCIITFTCSGKSLTAEWLEQANVSCAIICPWICHVMVFVCVVCEDVYIVINYGSGFHVRLKNVNVMISNFVGKPLTSCMGYLQTSMI